MATVETRARGTATAALVHSSAKWIAPSRPENIKLGLTRPVRKTTPSEDQPEVLTNSLHTKSLLCFGFDSARQVIVITKKAMSERKTMFVVMT